MAPLIYLLSFSLLLFGVFVPLSRHARQKAERENARRYRCFKLYAIKHYHPAFREVPDLARLSYDEISRRYDVDQVYESIGL